ncbi:MAG: hypothetical protein HQ504_01990 [Rhodospirillaceae bacterium]|nr:hypothetical protein [Rhodospirillaceae bacterium]
MQQKTNTDSPLGRVATFFGLTGPDRDPSQVCDSMAFDGLRLDSAASAPEYLPPLFGSRTRPLGRPEYLFPNPGKPSAVPIPEDIINGFRSFGLRGQIAGLNTYLNSSTDMEKIARPGKHLPWAAPLKIFRNAGSENVALAKHLTLRRLGVHAERLRFVWIEDAKENTKRVVLSVTLDSRNFILDSRVDGIVEDSGLPYYRPYCSLGETSFSLHRGADKKTGWETSLRNLGSHALH